MVKMDNVVRCYRGIDPVTGVGALFAVKNGEVFTGDDEYDFECMKEGVLIFNSHMTCRSSFRDKRLAALDQFELLWEKQE